MFPRAPSRRSHRYQLATALLGSLFVMVGCGSDAKKSAQSEPATAVESQCKDGVDNDRDGKSDCDDTDCQSPGGDCVAAPALDRTVASTINESASFLYSGDNPLQKGANPKAFDAKRMAIIKGRVIDATGKPLSGVRVTIAGHEEFGYTHSRSDGYYDLAVNGGSRLLVDITLEGYLTAQRAVTPGWQRHHYLGDVGLTVSGGASASVASDSTNSQVIAGLRVTDSYGEREPLVIFQPGMTGHAVLPDGSKEELSSLTVTVTEYPLAEAQQYLPGSAEATGLSYGLDFSVAEAKKLGASHVAFSEPVALYVENFLELPVGTVLPLGYYDEQKGQWEQGPAGHVIEVLDVADGKAVVDANGDGAADGLAELEALGVTESDLVRLGQRYPAGTQLMQGRVSHFSAYKAQVNLKAPKGAVAPGAAGLQAIIDRPTRRGNLLVEPRAAVEDLPITGTPYSLTYQSNRTTGFEAGLTLAVPVTPALVPAGLKRATVRAAIAGQVFEAKFDAKANQIYTVPWNGFDAYGRLIQGPERAEIFISYVYDGVLPNGTKPKKPLEVTLGQKVELQVGLWDFKGFELGGFGLDVLHAYHPGLRTVFFGDGNQRSAENVALVTKRANQVASFSVGTPDSVCVLSDGSLLVTDDQQDNNTALGRVLRITTDGKPSVVVGPGAAGNAASVQLGQPQGIVALDDGSLVVADILKNALRHIDALGNMTTLVSGVASDRPTVTHTFTKIDGLALGPRQELYIVDTDRVLKLEAGTLSTFAGGGAELGDGVDALSAKLVRPSGVAVSAEGIVYLSDRDGNRVRAVLADGSITTIAGKGTAAFSGDGGNAIEAELSSPRGLALGPDGSVYVVDQGNNRIRRVTPDGLIQTVIGGGTAAMEDGLLSTNVILNDPDGIAMSPDGTLYVATKDDILRVAPGLPELNEKETLIPSDDGHTLYRFDHRGKHLATIDAVTGVAELTFGYDATGFLNTVTDESGLVTTIQRNAEHRPTSIVGPYGQATQIELSTDGWFAKVTDPIARSYELTWNAKSGLLDKIVDPTAKAGTFTYDITGRLESITSPTGYTEVIAPASLTGGTRGVTVTTKGGKVTEYSHKATAAGGVVRSVKSSDGNQSTTTELATSRTGTSANGTQVMTYLMPDTAFGPQSMIPSESTVTLPSGKKLTTSFQRTKKVTDILNPLTLEDWREDVYTNGRLSSIEYHRSDRTLTTTSPMGRTATTTFDSAGRPVKVISPGMPVVDLTYDGAGRVTSITKTADGKSRLEVRGHGSDGWLSTATDALGHVVGYDWDLVGRPETLTRPDSKTVTWGFDQADNVKSLTTPANSLHLFDYDVNTKLLTVATPPTVAALGVNGLTAGQKTYSYGVDHELTEITLSDGRGIAFTYTPGGQLQSQKLASATLSFGYAKGQLTSVNRSDGVKVEMTYDGALPTASTWSGAISGSVKSDYDTNLWLKSITVNDASTVSYSYDDDGLVVGASSTAGAMSITRDANSGVVTGTTLGSVTSANQYSGFAELSSVSYASVGIEAFGQDITRDDLGRIATLTERASGVTHQFAYAYDNLGRLTTATRDGVVTSYSYDANGNRTSVQVGSAPAVAATYDAQDRILTNGTQIYMHSPAGNLETRTDGTTSLGLTYDELGNLTKAVVSDSGSTKTIDYVVDGLGRRVARKVNGAFDRGWLYRDGLRPVSEIDAAGTFTHFVYAESQSGAPDFMIRSGVVLRVVKDHLGSVRAIVDVQTGAVVQAIEYDAFGVVLSDTNPGFQPFGFAGGVYDAGTGLVRFGARDYDASIGRWTNKDPIGFAGGDTNVYAYVGNDPVNRRDPSGLEEVTSCGLVYASYGLAVLGCAGSILSYSAAPFTWGMSTVGSVMATTATCGSAALALGAVVRCQQAQDDQELKQVQAAVLKDQVEGVRATCKHGEVIINAEGFPKCIKK